MIIATALSEADFRGRIACGLAQRYARQQTTCWPSTQQQIIAQMSSRYHLSQAAT